MSVNVHYPDYVQVIYNGAPVSATNPLPTTGGGGGGGGGAVTLAAGAVEAGAYVAGAYVSGALVDGAIVTLGALGDVAVGDAAGSVNAHARQIAKLLGAPLAVSQSGAWTVGLSAGVAAIGSVSVSNFPATQPVSGTVTANAGSGTFAIQATAGSPGSVELSDGTAFYVGAKTGQLPAALVSNRLDVNVGAALPAGSNSIGTVVLGAGAAAVGSVSVSNFPATQPVSGSVSVTNFPATQPVSGTVTANAGSGTFPMQATAAAPGAVQLSDGSAFYVGAKTGQLPAALISSRLDVNLGKAPGTISSVNSSSATLLANAVFTGTAEDVSSFALIEVSVFADQASAGGGLSLQFSSDGTHWDMTQAVTISANAGAMFALCPCAEFFRLVYTNGATNQGAFRLQTLYRPVAAPQTQATFQDVNAALSPTSIVQRVAADLMIQDAADNVTSRIRSAKDLITGVGGSTLLGQAAGIYDPGGAKFWPWEGTQTGGGFVQGPAAAGATVVGNPLLTGGSDGANAQPFKTDTSGRQVVVGAAAAGAGIAGNPLAMGLSDTTNAQYWRQVAAAATAIPNGLGVGAVGMYLNNGGASWFPAVNGGAQGDGNGGNGSLSVFPVDWNGSNTDRHRNNLDVTLLSSGSRSTTQGPTTLTTYNAGAIQFVLDMTLVGTGSVTLTINEVDPASGKSILLLSGAAVVSNVTNVYTIDPIIASVTNVSKNARTPRTLNWTVTANNGNAAQYSLGAMVEVV